MSKSILITQNQLKNYSGSEATTLELVEELSRRGWSITVLTHFAAAPAVDDIANLRGVTIAKTSDKKVQSELSIYDFDFIWIHHYTLTERLVRELIENAATKKPKVFSYHMSYQAPIEDMVFPDFEKRVATRVLFNADETKQYILEKHHLKESPSYYVFDNPAPDGFLRDHTRIVNDQPGSVAIISNHPPSEIVDAAALLEQQGIKVDLIGRNHKGKEMRVTPELIASYDAVVSIGKTVQYALLSTLPVFCYDRFGGPGYLSADNFELAHYNNFSGRGFNRMSSQQIADNIVRDYRQACDASVALHADHAHRFLLSTKFDEVISADKKSTKDTARPFDEASVISYVATLGELVPTKAMYHATLRQLRDLQVEQNPAHHGTVSQGEPSIVRRGFRLLRRAKNGVFRRAGAILNHAKDNYGKRRKPVLMLKNQDVGVHLSIDYGGNRDYATSSKELKALEAKVIDWNEEQKRHREHGKVSVVVLAYSGVGMVERCIDSLLSTENEVEVEVIIVNNGGNYFLSKALFELKNLHPSLVLVTISTNVNFALGNSIGFQYATGDTVIFLNDDTYVTDHWVDTLYNCLSDPTVKVAQPLLLYPDGTIQNAGIAFTEKSNLGYAMYLGFSGTNRRVAKDRRVRSVTGACMAIRARDYVEHRGFDPVYINGQEDTDLCMRLGGNAADIGAICAKAIVYHDESKSPGRGKYVHANRRTFVERWKGTIVPDDIGKYRHDGYTVIDWNTDSELAGHEIAYYTPVLVPAQEEL